MQSKIVILSYAKSFRKGGISFHYIYLVLKDPKRGQVLISVSRLHREVIGGRHSM